MRGQWCDWQVKGGVLGAAAVGWGRDNYEGPDLEVAPTGLSPEPMLVEVSTEDGSDVSCKPANERV